ncbi:hypothetical protein PG988_007562 [Apiospora saccharicola]
MPSFSDLPPELRQQVYELCLVRKEPVNPWRSILKRGPSYGLVVNMLRVSKAVYHEAAPVLYSRNIFDLDDRCSEALALFLDRIGPANADQLRHIIVAFPKLSRSSEYFHPDQGFVAVFSALQSRCPRVHT